MMVRERPCGAGICSELLLVLFSRFPFLSESLVLSFFRRLGPRTRFIFVLCARSLFVPFSPCLSCVSYGPSVFFRCFLILLSSRLFPWCVKCYVFCSQTLSDFFFWLDVSRSLKRCWEETAGFCKAPTPIPRPWKKSGRQVAVFFQRCRASGLYSPNGSVSFFTCFFIRL